MTITQTVEIPADRRLVIEVPPQVPAGKINVIIQFPVREDEQSMTTELEPEKQTAKIKLRDTPTPISDSLVGILSGMGDIDLDSIRMERLAKHL